MKNKPLFEINEIIRNYELSESFIVECVKYEWIQPCDCEKNLFDEEDIARLKLIQELKRDFGVNDESVPIILHLLDQIHALKLRLKQYVGQNKG